MSVTWGCAYFRILRPTFCCCNICTLNLTFVACHYFCCLPPLEESHLAVFLLLLHATHNLVLISDSLPCCENISFTAWLNFTSTHTLPN